MPMCILALDVPFVPFSWRRGLVCLVLSFSAEYENIIIFMGFLNGNVLHLLLFKCESSAQNPETKLWR